MTKLKLGIVLGVVLFAHQAMARDGDGPNYLLKEIDAIQLDSLIDRDKSACTPDFRQWETNMEFVAHQSAKLKILSERESKGQLDQLSDRHKQILFAGPDSAEHEAEWRAELHAAEKKLNRHIWMPTLYLSVLVLETGGGCAAYVRAELSAFAQPTRLLGSDAEVGRPSVTLWSKASLLVGPVPTFTRRLNETGEQFIKTLVNDWAASQ